MDVATKLLMMMMEGEVLTANQVISSGGHAHQEATFRARFISVYHALRAVDEMLQLSRLTSSVGTMRGPGASL